MKDFLFLGGDLRFIYAAAKLNKTFDCAVYGFDAISELKGELPLSGLTMLDRLERYKNVVLPLPMSRNCDYITAPYSNKNIPITDVLDAACEKAHVYCGKACPSLRVLCDENGLELIDYFEREELTVLNAAITAEGAVEIIMRESALTVMNMNVLVTGYGRIAKVLSNQLRALGANVTVCARKCSDLSWARLAGCSAVHINEVESILDGFDTVVNTVPAQILDKSKLCKLKRDCLIIDLASKTGLEDMELAKSAGVKVIWALSLPGKVAPITAGEIVADTIINIITEREQEGS